MSASPARTGPSTRSSWAGSCCASPSTRTTRSYPFSCAYRNPVWTAPPIPRLNGSRITCAPRASATSPVRSVEPSETTTTSSSESNARSSSRTRPMFRSSLKAGTIAIRLSPARSGSCSTGRTPVSADTGLHAAAHELEQAPRAVPVGVLVEHALARASAHRLRLRRVVQQVDDRGGRLVGILDHEELRARLEPALDAVVRVRDDRGARRGELERPARRRRVDRRVRPPRDAEVDAGGRDRARERAERDVADLARAADVAAEVAAAESEVRVRQPPRRLADHRRDPLTPKLVAVAVEEDVQLLLDRLRREEFGVRSPEDGLGAAGAELAQPLEPAVGVRDHEVVLAGIGVVVPVEAGVHPAELGQAHRHVAVVEEDRDPEALAKRGRDAAEVRHRDGEDDHRVGALALDQRLEMAPPARRHPAPDHLAREAVPERVLGTLLRTARRAVALRAREQVARPRERLALEVGRIRRGPPPRRLDRPPAVRRDHEVGALLVQP